MKYLEAIGWVKLSFGLGMAVAGFIIASMASRFVYKTVEARYTKHEAQLTAKIAYYILVAVFLVMALQQFGLQLTALLGAAGIFTVALSFASKTAASNLVSGLFLIFERPFRVGDSIKVNGETGTVASIDLLSTKVTTVNNTLVRIPNETMMKSNIVNLSYSATRRTDMIIGVDYSTDIKLAKQTLLALAKAQAAVLPNPEPSVLLVEFADSSINLRLSIWTNTADAAATKFQLNELINDAFIEKGISMPFPHITLRNEPS